VPIARISLTWHSYNRREIVVDSVPHRLTPKLIELAFILMARRGRSIPMPEIIEFLWPDPNEEPDFAEDVIRTYVSRLRRILPAGAIVTRQCTCSNRMDPGFFLPGSLRLEPESQIAPTVKARRSRQDLNLKVERLVGA
jgi:DNA-binding SARP family transcriptional activator